MYLYKVRVLDGQGVVTGDKDTTVREWFTSKGSDRQGSRDGFSGDEMCG